MKRKSFLVLVLHLLTCASCGLAIAQPVAPSPPPPSWVFSLIGSNLETRSPVAIVGLARVTESGKVEGKATINDGGHICTARISGVVQQRSDGSADSALTLSTESGSCPSPLEFTGIISSSGKLFATIEVDSKMVTSGAAWIQ